MGIKIMDQNHGFLAVLLISLSGFHLSLILGFGSTFKNIFSYGGRCFSAVWGQRRFSFCLHADPSSGIRGQALPSAAGAGMRQLPGERPW